jgi:hypothetical protein
MALTMPTGTPWPAYAFEVEAQCLFAEIIHRI